MTTISAPWMLPTGEEVLPPDAPREQWLAERRKGIGGSDIPLIMGISPYSDTLYELWLDKTGRLDDRPQTESMRRGHWLEPHIIDHFAEQTNLEVHRCGLVVHQSDPILRTTVDRLTEDGGVVEAKTFDSRARVASEWYHGGIARHAYVQGQWQLLVTGRSHAWFVAYALDREPMIRGPIERDEPLIARIRERAVQWWIDHVIADTPPDVDLATITDEEIALRWPVEKAGATKPAEWPATVRMLLAEREQLKAAERDAKARTKEIDLALKVMIGDAEALTLGERPVVTLKSRYNAPSVDPALEKDHPEIWSRYVNRSKSRYINVCKGWDSV
jgi:putative phage-type endonuclease